MFLKQPNTYNDSDYKRWIDEMMAKQKLSLNRQNDGL